MAIALVGDALKLQNGSGASASAAFSATAGNALIVGGAMFGSGSWSVTRTGDTYTTDIQGTNSTDVSIGVGIASAPNVAGGSVTLQVTCTSAGAVTAYAVQLSGLPTSSIRDANSPAVASGSGTPILTNSLTNATADAIYFASGVPSTGINPTVITPLGGFSDTGGSVTMKETNDSTQMAVDFAYLIVASSASRTESWTTDVSAPHWAAAIAVYKQAAASSIPPGLGPVVEPLGGTQHAAVISMMR